MNKAKLHRQKRKIEVWEKYSTQKISQGIRLRFASKLIGDLLVLLLRCMALTHPSSQTRTHPHLSTCSALCVFLVMKADKMYSHRNAPSGLVSQMLCHFVFSAPLDDDNEPSYTENHIHTYSYSHSIPGLRVIDNPNLHSAISSQRSSFSDGLLSFSCSTDRLRRSFLPHAIRHFNTSQGEQLTI